ncbi:MAG: hypothetical protein WA705_25090 [Candidatus Ozemobacteraceae bacterium]
MRAYIIATHTIIEPFNDPIGETLLLDRPFKRVQEEALKAAGLEPVPVSSLRDIPTSNDSRIISESAIILHDTLFSTSRLFTEMLKLTTGLVKPFQVWAKKGLFTRLLGILQEQSENEEAVAFPLWYVPAGTSPDALSDAAPLVLDIDEDSYAGNFPEHMIKKEGYRFGVTSRPIMAVTHALHLALANMAANFARLAELKKMSWPQKIYTLLKARSINKFRILSAVSRIHPEAEVHPTAVIEGSVIEKGAKIGAHAVVRFSYVGKNAFIDDQAGIKFSVVGNGAYIANNCVLFFTTVYPRAFLISGPYQFSLFGYDSAMMNAIPSDYRLDGEAISVRTSRGVVSTGLKFVGSVIGHRTKIAAGVIVAPGRMVPNDLQILPDPARVLTTVSPGTPLNRPLFLIDGKLVPASSVPSSTGTSFPIRASSSSSSSRPSSLPSSSNSSGQPGRSPVSSRPDQKPTPIQANNPVKETLRHERGNLRQGPGRLSGSPRRPTGKNHI